MLKSRSFKPELMDNPDSDKEKLLNTVHQFKYINILLSASRRLIKKYFLRTLSTNAEAPYRFLDMGAGGCDIAIWVYNWCTKRGIPIEIICIENDKRIVPFARKKIENYPGIKLLETSAFNINDHNNYDFIFSNHFLHHLNDDSIVEISQLIYKKSHLFLMNDLERNIFSYIGYKIFAILFLHNSFANYDGGLSILRGFKKRELSELLERTQIASSISIRKAIPGRILLVKKRPDSR